MSAQRVSADHLEQLAWDHAAPAEVFMDAAFVSVGGREFVADLPAVTS